MIKGTGYSNSKISLSLAIVGKEDGLHKIDMIVVPYKKYMDAVSFSYNKESQDVQNVTISTTIISIDSDRFIGFIQPKLKIICDFYGIYGSFEINKGVPLGGGIGGSACPISAAIKAVESVATQLGIEKRMSNEDMVKLGSDVPCVYFGKPCRVQGFGEIITAVEDAKYYYKDYPIVTGVDTKKAYDIYDSNCDKDEGRKIPNNVEEAISSSINDLEYSACALNNRVKSKFEQLKKEGKMVIISGCGSTIFEISKTKFTK